MIFFLWKDLNFADGAAGADSIERFKFPRRPFAEIKLFLEVVEKKGD
jgi:hypothetical protein